MTVCYWCGAKDTLADIGKELDDGKYKMVQCSKCKNAYYVLNKEKMNKPKQMTNEEWLQSATTEELVKTILDLCDYRPCFACGIGYCDDENWCHVYSDEAKEFVTEWLKQLHT